MLRGFDIMHLTFRSLHEDVPGEAWRRVVSHGWPGWSEWFNARRGKLLQSREIDVRRAVRRHMPEYEALWDDLNQVSDADDDLALFLGFWCPPRYLVNCSQAVVIDDDGPFLIRNYDLDPALNEATFLTTGWRGTKVMGMVEAMAGLADGMNEHGLAASLTFGGRIETGRGFGIPLIMRYLLQMCRNVQEGVEALRAVPSHMSYNITLVDASGDWATVFVAPDRPAIVRKQPWATNHQLGVEWPRHGRISNTMGRAEHLGQLLKDRGTDATVLTREFQQEPVFSTNYSQGFGTVYTAAYRPVQRTSELRWRDGTTMHNSFQSSKHDKQVEQRISYSDKGSYAPAASGGLSGAKLPDWFGTFINDVRAPADEEEKLRLAAFWRRNHLGEDHGWLNLTPCSADKTEEDS
ncbi:C45 family peptidase [uncultured Aliiroseovarius sp.]|uniref:C45 family peptidase n=1 Tax=uncultured Aliiroseovarius sp. TaxID=1658783 RepID=UPI0026390838|nr:C45 family peptidase [uncultured Aliiroseovarius sp.]